MKKDDYFVIVYNILNYLYEQLKNGTTTVESINSSFRKVAKKGAFPNENALLKLLYLRITELYKKWNDSKVQNWAMVRNQLSTNEKISARIEKYEHTI